MNPAVRENTRAQLSENAARLTRRCTRFWGDPDYADDTIVAWDLSRVRARTALE